MGRERRPKPTEKKEGAVAADRAARIAALRDAERAKDAKRQESRKRRARIEGR
jgi:hypothetical protein